MSCLKSLSPIVHGLIQNVKSGDQMELPTLPFTITDWDKVEPVTYPGKLVRQFGERLIWARYAFALSIIPPDIWLIIGAIRDIFFMSSKAS